MAHSERQTFGAIADRLGQIKAQIADLKVEQDNLEAELKEMGAGSYEGMFFRAVVVDCAGSTKVDWKAVAQKLSPSRQLIQAHTSTSKGSTKITIYARKTA